MDLGASLLGAADASIPLPPQPRSRPPAPAPSNPPGPGSAGARPEASWEAGPRGRSRLDWLSCALQAKPRAPAARALSRGRGQTGTLIGCTWSGGLSGRGDGRVTAGVVTAEQRAAEMLRTSCYLGRSAGLLKLWGPCAGPGSRAGCGGRRGTASVLRGRGPHFRVIAAPGLLKHAPKAPLAGAAWAWACVTLPLGDFEWN